VGGVQVHDGLARGRSTAGGRHYPVPGGDAGGRRRICAANTDISRSGAGRNLRWRRTRRAVAAQKDGVLAEEIIPVTVRDRHGQEVIDTDEHPRGRHHSGNR